MKTVTDYSINKLNKDAIVYIDVNGEETRLTVNDFESEDEFTLWKEWSDDNLHEIEKKDHVEDSHCISTEEVIDSLSHSAEEELLHKERVKECRALLKRIRKFITPAQYCRLIHYYEDEMTLEEIASESGIAHQSIHESIQRAIRKIRQINKNIG